MTKHYVRVISNEMIANRIHVAAERSGESSFLKACDVSALMA